MRREFAPTRESFFVRTKKGRKNAPRKLTRFAGPLRCSVQRGAVELAALEQPQLSFPLPLCYSLSHKGKQGHFSNPTIPGITISSAGPGRSGRRR